MLPRLTGCALTARVPHAPPSRGRRADIPRKSPGPDRPRRHSLPSGPSGALGAGGAPGCGAGPRRRIGSGWSAGRLRGMRWLCDICTTSRVRSLCKDHTRSRSRDPDSVLRSETEEAQAPGQSHRRGLPAPGTTPSPSQEDPRERHGEAGPTERVRREGARLSTWRKRSAH